MPRRSTMKVNFLLRRLVEKYRETCKDLHMVFIDLEKAYDRVSREVIRWVFENKDAPLKYIKLIRICFTEL